MKLQHNTSPKPSNPRNLSSVILHLSSFIFHPSSLHQRLALRKLEVLSKGSKALLLPALLLAFLPSCTSIIEVDIDALDLQV